MSQQNETNQWLTEQLTKLIDGQARSESKLDNLCDCWSQFECKKSCKNEERINSMEKLIKAVIAAVVCVLVLVIGAFINRAFNPPETKNTKERIIEVREIRQNNEAFFPIPDSSSENVAVQHDI